MDNKTFSKKNEEKKALQVTVALSDLGIDFNYEEFYEKLQERSLKKGDIYQPIFQGGGSGPSESQATFSFEIKGFEGCKIQVSSKGTMNITFPRKYFNLEGGLPPIARWTVTTSEEELKAQEAQLLPYEIFLFTLSKILVEECNLISPLPPVVRTTKEMLEKDEKLLKLIGNQSIDSLVITYLLLHATSFSECFLSIQQQFSEASSSKVKIQYFQGSLFLLEELIKLEKESYDFLDELSKNLLEIHDALKDKELKRKLQLSIVSLTIEKMKRRTEYYSYEKIKKLAEQGLLHL
ncbi:MAG: hypothetical protein ACP5O8_04015 [Candidatus Aenigmatarchaeota archaeon]